MLIEEFWKFACARQQLMITGLTDDPILSTYRFTNCYRVCDRVSQYLVREVQDFGDRFDVIFRTLLFKTFNKISTWEWLQQHIGQIAWKPGFSNLSVYADLLAAHEGGRFLYAAAFRQPIGRTSFGHTEKFRNHLEMIRWRMTHVDELLCCQSLGELHSELRQTPMMGPFLAMQFATDFNYSEVFDFDDSFVVPGPGALRGAAKIFGHSDWKDVDAAVRGIETIYNDQWRWGFEHIRVNGQPRELSPMDIQNLFCEFDKYCRIARPELNTIGRWRKGSAKRPKQTYTPDPRGRMVYPRDFTWPRKWYDGNK